MSKNTFTKILNPGTAFGADFYINAEIEIISFGSPETGRGYMADPMKYDPGSGPEWSVKSVELFHDCGGEGEKVEIGPQLAEAIMEFIEEDKALREQVEEAIAEAAKEDCEP